VAIIEHGSARRSLATHHYSNAQIAPTTQGVEKINVKPHDF
jgi:hypothetical protein